MSQPERPRILIVDDEEAILETMSFTFMDLYDVLTTADPKKAISIIEENQPVAVVITDQRMPGMTGVELLKAVYERFPETVRIILTGFADMIDVFGGVRVNVPTPVDGPLYDPVSGGYEMVQIPTGSQHLDGGHALAYARARYGSGDYARMARQRCILASLAGQADPLEILTRLPDVLAVVEENLVTDIPVDSLPDLVRLLLSIRADDIRVVGFDATWRVGHTRDGHPVPDVARIREMVRATVENPGGPSDQGALTASEACG